MVLNSFSKKALTIRKFFVFLRVFEFYARHACKKAHVTTNEQKNGNAQCISVFLIPENI